MKYSLLVSSKKYITTKREGGAELNELLMSTTYRYLQHGDAYADVY